MDRINNGDKSQWTLVKKSLLIITQRNKTLKTIEKKDKEKKHPLFSLSLEVIDDAFNFEMSTPPSPSAVRF